MIKIKRDSGYADRLRAYKIVLDGDVVGEIKNGQELELNVTPCKHQLYLKIDWCRGNTIEFESEGATVEFECGSSLRGWRVLLVMIYVIFLRDKYLWLKRTA